jgi:polyisoprenyl-phosphate glycosyltransferase
MFNKMQCSIIIPTYNSATWIAVTIDRIIKEVAFNNISYELILVDDGSTDNTASVLNKKAHSNNNIRVVNMTKNVGQQQATLAGILEARGEYILTVDDDLEYDPLDIFLLYSSIKENRFDLIYGVPQVKKRGLFKKGLYFLYFALLKHNHENRKTSFRILNNTTASKLREFKEVFPFNLDFFLLKITRNVGYVDVKYFPNESSRYSLWDYIHLFLHIEFLKYQNKLNRHASPE